MAHGLTVGLVTLAAAMVIAAGFLIAGQVEDQRHKDNASAALADYLKDDPQKLMELILLTDSDRDFLPLLRALLRSASFPGRRNWFINSQGQTFAVVNGPVEFLMGREDSGKKVTISHRFAIAAHEVTVAQFRQFRKDHQQSAIFAPQPDCPVNHVSWYNVVAYCNWLSEQEGITKDQWCYEPNDKGEYAEGMKIPADFLQRTGYRLPTEMEWEYACRANTTSTYTFGEPEELLDRHAWYVSNSKNRTWSVGLLKPNGLGLFDMHGNVWEWCHDFYDFYGSKSNDAVEMMVENQESRILRGGAFTFQPGFLRSALQSYDLPANHVGRDGFRAARTYP